MKGALKSLHRTKYNHLSQRVEEATAKLAEIQQKMMISPFDEAIIQQEKDAREEVKNLQRAKLSLASQRAKVDWLSDMDANTKFFHAKVKEKMHRSKILHIMNEDGNVLTQPEDVKQEFIRYYTHLFGAKATSRAPVDRNLITRGRILSNEEEPTLPTFHP